MTSISATGLPDRVVAGVVPRRQAVGNPRGVSFGTSGPWSEREVTLYRATLLATLDRTTEHLCTLRQRHGVDVVERVAAAREDTTGVPPDRGNPDAAPAADAHWTADSAIVLTIQVADCYPVVLADRDGTRLALVHVGWRGAAGAILAEVVSCLARAGAPPDRLVAWVGPGADPDRYEVGPEVAARFIAWSEAVTPAANHRSMLDLPRVIRLQLMAAGLRSDAITVSGRGTIGDPAFHSHRRDGREAGRMWAFATLARRQG